MRLEDIKYFVEIVDKKSFNKAAETLYITQPALGNAIKNFETELGHELLHRSSSGIQPTLFGKLVYYDCVQMLDFFSSAYNSWQNNIELFSKLEGKIKIGTFPLIAPFLAANFYKELNALCPNLNISIYDLPLRHNLDSYLSSDVDIGIGVLESIGPVKNHEIFSQAKELGIEIHLIWRDQMKALFSSKNKLTKKGYVDQNDLEDFPLITYHENEREYIYPSPSTHTIYAHTTDQIFQMVQSNDGYFLACEKVANTHFALQSGLIKALEIRGINYPDIYLYVIHPRDNDMSLAQKTITELLYFFLADASI